MSLLRYRFEEARNIARAQNAAANTARIEGSIAKRLAAAEAAGLQTQIDGKEPEIESGTAEQYWGGDKTWRPLRYTQTFGNASDIAYVITHNKGTTDVITQVQNLTGSVAVPDVLITGVNTISVSFDAAPGVNAFRIVVI